MQIPLPSMLRKLREREFEQRLTPLKARAGLALWSAFATRPKLYGLLTGALVRVLGWLGRRRGRFSWLPLAGAWTAARDLPAPQRETFRSAYRRQRGVQR